MWERVHTLDGYFDGPTHGVADYRGRPHRFELIDRDDDRDVFALTLLEPSTLSLVMEAWAIWCRWREADDAGRTDSSTHPALPADRSRYEAIRRELEATPAPEPTVEVSGEFRGRAAPDTSMDLKVRWATT